MATRSFCHPHKLKEYSTIRGASLRLMKVGQTPAHHTNFALRTARARFALVCTVGFRTATGLGENTVRVHLARNLLCTTKS